MDKRLLFVISKIFCSFVENSSVPLEELKKTIRSYAHVSDSDMEFGMKFYKRKTFKKGDFLLKPGQYIEYFYFMKKGCVSYYSMEEGKAQVMEFFTEGSFFTDLYAYIQEIPSESYIEALEDITVYAISKTDVQKVFDYSHQLERFGRLSMQRTFVITFQRINQLRNLSNQERYLELQKKDQNCSNEYLNTLLHHI